jgi:hypothetical protein
MVTDREFILDQDKWPKWPLLPVKRTDEWGVIPAGHPAVYIVNMWGMDDRPLSEQASKVYEYKDVDALLADGWVVD